MTKIKLIILLFALYSSFIFTAASQYEEIEKGTLTADKPVTYEGIVMVGNGATVGNGEIKGTVTLPEMNNIEITNVNNFEAIGNGFRGTAQRATVIDGHNLGEGTNFIYNKDTGDLFIDDGGRVLSDATDAVSPNQFTKLLGGYSIKGPNGAYIQKDGSIILGKWSTLSHDSLSYYSGLPSYVFNELVSNFKITSMGDETRITFNSKDVKVDGKARVEYISGYEDISNRLDINGEGHLFFGTEQAISRIELSGNEKSTFERRRIFIDPINLPLQRLSITNEVTKPDGEAARNKLAIIFDDYKYDENFEGSIINLKARRVTSISVEKIQIDVKGIATVAFNENFKYQGLTKDSGATIKSSHGIQQLELNFPQTHEQNTELALINWGKREEIISFSNGNLKYEWSTGSLFETLPNTLATRVGLFGVSMSGSDGSITSNGPESMAFLYPPQSIVSERVFQEERNQNILSNQGISGSYFYDWIQMPIIPIDQQIDSRKERFLEDLKEWPTDWSDVR